MDVKSLLILKCFCLLILYFNPIVEGDIPYGVCVNPECSGPVGKGITLIHYASPDDSRISVEPNEEVEIYVKEYGPKKDLWGVIVRGHRGYISKNFIRETQSFTKNFVPARVEFKTSVLVTNDYTVTSHLHVSSYHHQPDSLFSNTVPESSIRTQTLQHDNMNSAPSSHQQMWNSPSEHVQASHLSPNFDPSNAQFGVQFSQHGPSEHLQASHLSPNFDPSNAQFSQHGSSEHLQASHLSPNFDPSNAQFGVHSQVYQSSVLNNVPEHSSHFHSDPGNIYASSHITGMQSENILPSQSHVPDVRGSSLYQDNSMLHPPYHESGPNNVPNFNPQNTLGFSHSDTLNPDYVYPSQTYQSFNEHPSSVQKQPQQQFESPYVPEMHSSYYSPDYFDPMSEEEISKTFAMLNDRGIDSSYMYSNSNPQSVSQQSSHNVKSDFISSEAEFNAVPSQSQYSSIQSSDASLYSSVNPNPSINVESKISSSDVLKENINEPSQYTGVKTENFISDKTSVDVDMEKKNEESQSEIRDETNDDFEYEDEEDEEEEVEVDGTSRVNDAISSSKYVENSDLEFSLKSSISSSLTSEERSKVQDIQSSMESSIADSNLVDDLQKEHGTVKERKASTLLSDQISTNNESIHLETKVLESSVIMHTTTETSINKQGEYTDGLTKTDLKATPEVISDVSSSDLDKMSRDSDANLEKNFGAVNEPLVKEDVFSDILDRNNYDAFQSENAAHDQDHSTPTINEFFTRNDENSELNKIVNTVNIDRVSDGIRSTYQIRNLKGEHMTSDEQQSDSEGSNDENNTDSDSYNSFENGLNALKTFVDSIMSWIPEPLYSVLMDLQNKGISPRVPVFTVVSGIVCILIVVPLIYIKERSKESRLITQLASVEKNAYTLSAANNVLQEKLESLQSELTTLQTSLKEERAISESLKCEFENQTDELESVKAELESCLEELDSLKEKENEYLSLLNDNEKEKENLLEHKNSLDKIITEQEDSIASLNDQLQENADNLKELEKEKSQFLQMKEDYEEKITQFERNCNQLLQEAEVWNLRVNELTLKLNEEVTLKEEFEASLKEKNEEIESLKELVETFKSFEEIEDPEDETKTKEEKLQSLINSSMILNQLKKEEEKNKILEEQLGKEKNRILDMEVDLLDAKSEIDKLKMSYNQALQDKAEAQTKLDVLTNYFKDKEIQLQKQLGAQEAVRQKKEEDASSAERRICLIEQENASYKYQVASMKQEMEETERNLKSQIAAQEKKAHENWIAARGAERKLEDMKQEVTQLRQRLTLLEREQENWANSSRDDIIRPVPKRIPGASEDSGGQDMNTSERGMFPPPSLHDRLPPPMMLPPDRPLPPLPPLPLPPPMPPMFLPPMDQHFRPQPWHLPPDHSSDYRSTPPEFMGGRESTPPRGRQSAIIDGETGPNTSSPLTTDTRDSQNSTPPHLLPDFHDVPPQPGRPFFPPPPLRHPRLPMQTPYRRDPVPKRLDNSNEYHPRGSQQPPPPPEQWQHSRV